MLRVTCCAQRLARGGIGRHIPRRRGYATLTPPLVDVRCFGDAGADDERSAAAAAASRACREHGLLALPRFGGIEPVVVSDAFDSVKHLFALPLDEKMRLEYRDVRENVGYIQEGNEKPDPQEAAPDPKEVFQFQPGKRELPPELERPLARLFDAGVVAGRLTLRCLARSLGLADETFASAARELDLCSLRAIYYPGGVAPLSNRCGAHSDFGMCTLLLNERGGPPGLQAVDPSGAWCDVMPPAGADAGGHGVAYVNLGDMLARWTNDEVCSTRHRVVAPANEHDASRSRFVIALFIDADAPTSLEALPPFVSRSRPMKYAPMSAGDFKAMRLAAQTDVQ